MIRIAFKNIRRNKKRTILTIVSTALGIMGLLFFLAYIDGLSAVIEREVVKQTGHIQITAKDYERKSRVLDNSSNIPYEELTEKISKIHTKSIEPIIKFGAYGFVGEKDEKLLSYGVSEESYFKDYIYEGRFLTGNSSKEIVLGKTIKEKLNLSLGQEFTLVVNTQFSSSYALNYKIIGFVNEPMLNKSAIIKIKDAEYLLDMEGKSSELHIYLENKNKIYEMKKELISQLKGYDLQIKTFDEIGFATALGMYEKIKYVLAFLMGLLCSVGIFNTMVISVFERKKEIGIIKALGMEESQIKKLIVLEGGILGFIGSGFGVIIGSLFIYYFSIKGIYVGNALKSISDKVYFGERLYTSFTLEALMISFFTGFIVSLIASYLPAKKEVQKEIIENFGKK